MISWPYFRRHALRTLLTTAGIVLGVAVFVGMHTANQSVLYAFSRTVDRIACKTELQAYVVQLERQTGEWVLVGGYAGEVVTERRSGFYVRPRSRHRPRVCRTRFLHGRPEPERGSGGRGPRERRR